MNETQKRIYYEVLQKIAAVPGYPQQSIEDYLAPLDKIFGDAFDPLHALDDLQASLNIARREISRNVYGGER